MALCGLQRSNLRRDCRSALELGHIVGYTFGNHVLLLRSRVAVKLNFLQYIRNENFEYSYPLIDYFITDNNEVTLNDKHPRILYRYPNVSQMLKFIYKKIQKNITYTETEPTGNGIYYRLLIQFTIILQ